MRSSEEKTVEVTQLHSQPPEMMVFDMTWHDMIDYAIFQIWFNLFIITVRLKILSPCPLWYKIWTANELDLFLHGLDLVCHWLMPCALRNGATEVDNKLDDENLNIVIIAENLPLWMPATECEMKLALCAQKADVIHSLSWLCDTLDALAWCCSPGTSLTNHKVYYCAQLLCWFSAYYLKVMIHFSFQKIVQIISVQFWCFIKWHL